MFLLDNDRKSGKQPFYVSSRSGDPLTIAGLWEDWRNPEGETIRTATMIVTAANGTMQPIHDRMPVFLDRAAIGPWLDGTVGSEILMPANDDLLQLWPVSRRVNKPGNGDDPTLIEQVEVAP